MRRTIPIWPVLLAVLLALAAPASAQTAPNPGCTAAFDPPNVGFLKDSTRYTATKIIRFYSITNMGLWITCPTVLPVDSTAYNAALATIAALRDTITALRTASPPPPTPVDSIPPPSAGLYPNRPASFTTVLTDYGFTAAAYPTGSSPYYDVPNFDGSGWGVVGNSVGTMTRVADATAPVSPSSVLQWKYAKGSGTPTSSAGFGNLYLPCRVGTANLYIAVSVWHDPNFEFNLVANKMIYLDPGTPGYIVLQSRMNSPFLTVTTANPDANWYPNAYIPTASDLQGHWARLEYVIQRGNPGVIKGWIDGKLFLTYTGFVAPPNSSCEISLNSTWGGGNGPTTRDSYRRMDHILVATTP